MAKHKYQVIKDSGALGLNIDEETFLIGSRVFENLSSNNSSIAIGAKKRFTHEWWHYLFANLPKDKQEELLADFQENVLGIQDSKPLLSAFAERLYKEEAYHFHFADEQNEEIFVNEGFGIKTKEIVEIDINEETKKVYGALFLTELLSLSSESETLCIEEYYSAVKPNDEQEISLWENKKELGALARQIVLSMNSSLIDSEFKNKTEEGIELLQEMNSEYKTIEAEDSKEIREQF